MARNHDEDPRTATVVDQRIGALIRERRQELGVSQTTLADAVGVTFQQIQKYEKGVNRVSASTLMEIALALDTRVSALLPLAAKGEAGALAGEDLQEALKHLARLNEEGRRVAGLLLRSLAGDARYSSLRRD